jgi:hypothetical protein
MNADVIFAADHFVMVTTIESDNDMDMRSAEHAAWERLVDEYGVDWVNTTKKLINTVSVEVVPQSSINDIMKSLAEEEPSDE